MKIVIVGGGGHVGLPLGVLLALEDNEVIALDVSQSTIDLISLGNIPFHEEGLETKLREALGRGTFSITTSPESLRIAECVIFVVGTPVDEFLAPKPNQVIESVLNVLEFIPNEALIILRSTVYPGVTQKLCRALATANRSNKVIYAPERIAEGKAIIELPSLPQIIGGNDFNAMALAGNIFASLTDKVLMSSYEEAELAKLFTNVWRYLKFAASNQFFMMANDIGVDYGKLRKLITQDYPRAQDLPSAGFAAGPCLFKDTMQLSALVQQNFPLGITAMSINEGLPGYIVKRISQSVDLASLKVGILGMAFKADNDDIRGSLAFKLRKLLQFHCREVYMTDPFVNSELNKPLSEVVTDSDLLILATPHSEYRNLELDHKRVIDIWNYFEAGTLF